MMRILLSLVSRNALSQLVGKIVHIPLPWPLSQWSIEVFARMYNIRLDEAEKNTREYRSIGDFFTRKLKPGLRPIDDSSLAHPADSVISQCGWIEKGSLIQAKGRQYLASELLQNQDFSKKFLDGFFATYYLCPTDYHRVHSPVDGKIHAVKHVPGDLWPVNNWSVNSISNLFPINERVVLEMETPQGWAALVFVGATNVGKISLSFEPKIATNLLEKRTVEDIRYAQPVAVRRGDELGIFHMGSTVVMLYEKSLIEKASKSSGVKSSALADLIFNKSVRVGQRFL